MPVLSGRTILSRSIITSLLNTQIQRQPCSIDLSLKTLSSFTSRGTLDFSNALRKTASTSPLAHEQSEDKGKDEGRYWDLSAGAYLMEFNEVVDVPLDCVGFLYPRSSLWRSGAVVGSGVVDAGYKGAMGCCLQVLNPHGIRLYENARVAQMVFHGVGEGVGKGYKGTYQGAGRV